ncbi:hypothetical protein PRZ48_005666 [Zasmidium cellare]|uniref:F-box domain-containing protein n=1 Tax=Zasmidium cellare TaxID=395010 RepID=A0ABR0ELU7_ZASCE|nr:hypothetical protein PRZ48_005666 [Zasmidium cellare]
MSTVDNVTQAFPVASARDSVDRWLPYDPVPDQWDKMNLYALGPQLSLNPIKAFTPRGPSWGRFSLLGKYMTQTIRSYPYMMHSDETYAPFIHRECMINSTLSTHKNEPGPLLRCTAIVELWRSKTRNNASYLWRILRMEQERLRQEISEYEDLMAINALQAVTIYFLLRVSSPDDEDTDFDVPLIQTMTQLSWRVRGVITAYCDVASPARPSVCDWVMAESLRRTIAALFIIELLFDISPGVINRRGNGPAMWSEMLLPCSRQLWEARTEAEWTQRYDLLGDERPYYGELLQHEYLDCDRSSLLDRWMANVDDFGRLVINIASVAEVAQGRGLRCLVQVASQNNAKIDWKHLPSCTPTQFPTLGKATSNFLMLRSCSPASNNNLTHEHPTFEMDWPHILRLPMELLLHIASFVDIETGILHLRLTCQALAAAALDRFAEAYISDLRCFIFDPSRLLRIKAITSTPYLASKISTLTFTICAYERSTWGMPVPTRERQGLQDAQETFAAYYNKEQFRKHRRSLRSSPSRHSRGWCLIRSIMQDLRHRPNCNIAIDTFGESDPGVMYLQMKAYSQAFVEGFLQVSFETGRSIQKLHLSDRLRLDPAKYGRGSRLLSVLRNVKTFYYDVYPDRNTDNSPHNPEYLAHFEASKLMMENLTNVRELKWAAAYGSWLEDIEKALGMAHPAVLLAVDKMVSLERLWLRDMALPNKRLLKMLQACSATLTSVRFENMHLEHDGDSWTTIFRCLRMMPRLQEIYIDDACMHDPGDKNIHVLQYLLSDDESFTRHREPPAEKYLPCQPFLDWNLEHGLIYKVEEYGSWEGI